MKRVIKQHGHTLLELLIALALALFISSTLIEIFLQCKKTYDLTQRLNDRQSSARIAFNWLSHDIRMAGLIGCARLLDVSPLNTSLTPHNRLLVWQSGLVAEKLASLPDLPRAKARSDIILIQFLDPDTFPVRFAQDRTVSIIGKSPFRVRDKCLISDCRHAEAFEWGHAHLQHRYQYDSEVGFLNKIIYYIGNTGDRTPTGKPIFALYRRNLNKSIHIPTELVSGIETLSVRLGVSDLTNGQLHYFYPQQLKNWLDVRSVEITLVLESENAFGKVWRQVIGLRE